ncbi:MAG: hypothetical protein Fur002_14130 [Anaerolineales bacterium]
MKKHLAPFAFLLLIAAAAYLPHINELTYFKDDWYYVYDGIAGGAKIFHEMFRIDRPIRGYFFEWYFSLLGAQPLAWHIGAFLWRALSAIGAWWLFSLIWKEQKKFVFLSAALFAIYPGYYWWTSAIEYQPMIASLALQVFSFAFTVKGLQVTNFKLKVAYALGAILTGLAYIALVDYAVGMEAFRLILIYLWQKRSQPQPNIWRALRSAAAQMAIYLLIPFSFFAWRTLFFENQRKATDVSRQLGAFIANPAATGAGWALQTLNSLWNVAALSWTHQFSRFFFALRMREVVIGLSWAAAALVVFFIAQKVSGAEEEKSEPPLSHQDAARAGALGALFGVLPVIMANRYVNNEAFSHYALPLSLAASLFFAGMIYSLSWKKLRIAVSYLAIAIAVLTHYGVARAAIYEERALEKFWREVAWRAPSLQSGTLLVIRYPSANLGDDGNGVMEMANALYFPVSQQNIPVEYPLTALTLNEINAQEIANGMPYQEVIYRSHLMKYNYDHLLVISQPAPSSCAHIIDGRQPLISTNDPASVILVAERSNLQNIHLNAPPAEPPAWMFGKEPPREWCYYYESVELALQRGEWEQAADLSKKAESLQLTPEDRSEWLPLLYAYARTGDETRVKQTASKINREKALRLQACAALTEMQDSLTPQIQNLSGALFCKTQ